MTTPSLRDALLSSPSDDCPECGAPPTQEQVAAILALLDSDECADAIGTTLDADPLGCDCPKCVVAALIAYLTADALTKEGEG